ncbi:GNAT family N-acetyltransferase [Pseudoalteromonas neustonica]|uniref:GNAT family N-acetyltransferase n=1 Tax=Pseudoalteromonas neustonica TaxID=1840331 RepID=UPI0007DB662F|nr:GNAT family protein [Pseudoalteromonas neustonica]
MIKLRSFQPNDVLLLIKYLNNLQVTHFLSSKIPSPYTEEDARWWIEKGCILSNAWAIELDGQCVGCIGAMKGEFEYSKSAEIGYWLAQEYWGQGVVTTALALLIAQLQATEVVRLHAVVFENNLRSAKVLEKNGFLKEGCLHKAIYKNDRFYNALIYGKVVQ